MEHTRIPKPGVVSRLPSRVKEAPIKSNIVRQPLRRRSKSFTDLRSVKSDLPSMNRPKPTIKPLEERPMNIRSAPKRPATSKPPVEKPKVAKVVTKKIPDWDYKARFADLQGKYSALQAQFQEKKQECLDFEGSAMELATLKEESKANQVKLLVLENQIEALQRKNEKLQETNKELTNSLRDLNEKYLILRSENAELLEQSKQNLEKALTLEKSNGKLELELRLSRELCSNLEQTVSDLKATVEGHEATRRKLHNTIQDLKGNIRVFCRVRPAIGTEADEKLLCNMFYPDETVLEIKKSRESCFNGKQSDLRQEFTFDRVFPPNSTQAEIFQDLSELVQSALDGYNVCVFAYGQTGSGKTHTMLGTPEDQGVIPRTIDLIFYQIKKLRKANLDYTVSVSFLEIYNENIRNLLDPKSTQSYELRYNEGRGVTVTNLKIVPVESDHEMRKLMREAQNNRAVAATDFNLHSSRSHAVTKIQLLGHNTANSMTFAGSINLVDLAGSESAKTTTTERLTETKNINKSLSTLGKVMGALHNKDSHIPYRDSKLTYLLQSCLGGDSKTLMFVNISPFDECYGESVNSLRFAAKVKEVKTVAKRKCVKLPSS